MLQGKYCSQIGGIREVQPLGKGLYQIVLENKDFVEKHINVSCNIRNTQMFMHKWIHGFNLVEATQQKISMKKLMMFSRLSLQYNVLLPSIGNSFGLMLKEELIG